MDDLVVAKRQILFHAGWDLSSVSGSPCFLERLRPYQGLSELAFAEVMNSIMIWHPSLVAAQMVDKQIVTALWDLCCRTRGLVLRPNSSVQTNKLITSDDLERLRWWIEVIESASLGTLQGWDLRMAMHRLMEYLVQFPNIEHKPYAFLMPLLTSSLTFDDEDVRDTASKAIALLRSSHPELT
jgi:hypothetical protein